jgi:hypothetical protein
MTSLTNNDKNKNNKVIIDTDAGVVMILRSYEKKIKKLKKCPKICS